MGLYLVLDVFMLVIFFTRLDWIVCFLDGCATPNRWLVNNFYWIFRVQKVGGIEIFAINWVFRGVTWTDCEIMTLRWAILFFLFYTFLILLLNDFFFLGS